MVRSESSNPTHPLPTPWWMLPREYPDDAALAALCMKMCVRGDSEAFLIASRTASIRTFPTVTWGISHGGLDVKRAASDAILAIKHRRGNVRHMVQKLEEALPPKAVTRASTRWSKYPAIHKRPPGEGRKSHPRGATPPFPWRSPRREWA